MSAEQNRATAQAAGRMWQLRKTLGWSAQELANTVLEKTGCTSLSRATIANLENGRRAEIYLTELLALAEVFGVSVDWLATGAGTRCGHCNDAPPTGFRCQRCHAVGEVMPHESAHS
ncbi:MAG TPA: helix-turn-helix transcriptional regulator [Candidatus Limnocylindrales bacterium]|nr:helix-turn-helix transcriptional regulator [Candidatus Limnocylindrales bacterium]